ncbi:MAG TPA: hypothetical protein VEJ20_09290 [Candidatus Eremiobacteraceae bacterium]|nr:hypothetical protein [Candidatus Eremiobacteraceae bacterium]
MAKRASRGIAMPAALLILFLMVVLVGALMGIINQELKEVAYTGYDNRALYLADAGVEEMVSLAEEAAPGIAVQPSPYNFPADSNGVDPQFAINSLTTDFVDNRRTYLIDSEGITSEGNTRYVQAIAIQNTFANYNYAGWSNAAGNYFVSGLMQYNGPVYLGGGSSNPVNIWWQDGDASIFESSVLAEGSVDWWTGSGEKTPSTTADWLSVASGGSPAYSHTNTAIGFPPNAANAIIASEAFAGLPNTTMPAPSNGNGVYVNGVLPTSLSSGGTLDTGIFVQGDADISMSTSSTTATPQTETITFSPVSGETASQTLTNTVTVTVNYTANTTSVQQGTSAAVTVNGVPSGDGTTSGASANGAIFVNGNVDSLAGTMSGQQTIAVPDNTNETNVNNIVISGDISYEHDPQTCSCTSTDMLGIIGHNVEVASGAPADLTIEGAVFAGNSQDYANQNGQGTFETQSNVFSLPLKGPLLVYGSLVNAAISPLGVFNGSTGALAGGWGDSYTWDQRFKTQAPPFYPGESSFTIVAWYDCGTNNCSG